ncbi:hypothetical protein F2Q68_00019448 [Brassica cretica]|uniref:Pentacotripeptide-repeat region of PRORP domain-containing protein n=1 Tax=Brassica cretica TaxID=69181 RepID=A0A8S9FWS3_BRACR|nr:hypothetical protein F2Q68_00019448 [Brassica cretica]
MRSILIAIALAPKRFVHQNLQGTGSPLSSLSSFCCWGRAFSGRSDDDYRDKLRNGFLEDIKIEDAVGLFSEMVKSPPFPSIIEFSKLLTAIAKSNKFDVVISLGEKMEMLGITLDLYTYSILINCFCRSSQLPLGFSYGW